MRNDAGGPLERTVRWALARCCLAGHHNPRSPPPCNREDRPADHAALKPTPKPHPPPKPTISAAWAARLDRSKQPARTLPQAKSPCHPKPAPQAHLTPELSGRRPRPLEMRNDAGGPLERVVRWALARCCLAGHRNPRSPPPCNREDRPADHAALKPTPKPRTPPEQTISAAWAACPGRSKQHAKPYRKTGASATRNPLPKPT
jgi:hypothetical protein